MLRKVLVIDGSTVVHHMYKLVFKRYKNCELFLANSRREAFEMLSAGCDMDLVLLDTKVPGMDGREFFDDVKNAGICDYLPVIIVSAMGPGGVRDDVETCAMGYLQKPFMPSQLHSLIEKLFTVGAARPGQARI